VVDTIHGIVSVVLLPAGHLFHPGPRRGGPLLGGYRCRRAAAAIVVGLVPVGGFRPDHSVGEPTIVAAIILLGCIWHPRVLDLAVRGRPGGVSDRGRGVSNIIIGDTVLGDAPSRIP